MFNTVEGNTTFYRIPDASKVAAWRNAVAGTDFKFCFKLPRTVTHERSPALDDLRVFLRAIEPMGDHIGPLLVQFPAGVGPEQLLRLKGLFSCLPRDFRCVVEVRHPRFFTQPRLLQPLLDDYRLGRVVLDTRALYEGNRTHPEVVDALHEEPGLPVLPEVYNGLAFVRLVLHPVRLYNQHYIEDWISRVADYVAKRYTTYVMIHCPNNLHCPEFALQFHNALMGYPGMGGLAAFKPWPVPQQGRLL